MCLAIPGRIVSIDNNNPELLMAKVSFAGIKKDVCIEWIEEPKVGEYIIAHVGYALNKIDEAEAKETLRLIEELGDSKNK